MCRWVAIVLALGCGRLNPDPIDAPKKPPDGGGPPGDGAGPVMDAMGACVPRASGAPAHLHMAGTGTMAGTACLAAGCHGPGGQGPFFQFAGTVFDTNLKPTIGVTVRVADPNGVPLASLISDQAGNFYYEGIAPNPFPSSAAVSGCPAADQRMVQFLPVDGGGDCNSCHDGMMSPGPITIPAGP
jgi:hypothetical protein